jgi:acetyl-CoA C-acetyltransferase
LTTRPQPAGLFPQDYDVQAEADALRGPLPALIDGYAGPASIETYTVVFDREARPTHGVILARISDGRCAIARVAGDDAATVEMLTSGAIQPVGRTGEIIVEGAYSIWRERYAISQEDRCQ